MKKQILKLIPQIIILLIVLVFSFSFFAKEASAVNSASLYLSPSTGSYTVGNTFSVEVKVNSGGVAINAVESTMSFDPDKLEVRSISKIGSALTLWVQEPTFSNSAGSINFAGGKPSPGYSGSSGHLVTITFKAKTAGTTYLNFAGGSVMADDGKGTNVLSSMGTGSYVLSVKTITPIPPEEEEEYVPTEGVPAVPKVYSATHPDETKWYSNSNPEFTWKLPSDILGTSLLFSEKPTANPGDVSDGLTESKNYEGIKDGTWYFHLKYKNQYGWGEILHRKVLIDTVPPDPFDVRIDNEGDPQNPSPAILFKATDSLSGIEYYEVKIDELGSLVKAEDVKDGAYYPLPLKPGKHKVEITALDMAGNSAIASAEFEVLPLETPRITKIPKTINIGDILEIEGEALPGVSVRIYIQKKDAIEPILKTITADLSGRFAFTYDKLLAKDNYFVWAQAENEKGALSYPTKKYPLEVGLPPFLKFGKIAIDYLTTMVTLIVLVAVIILIMFYAWYRISLWRRRLRKETGEVSQSVNDSFRNLREEVSDQISMLDKKPGLTKEEKVIHDKLRRALDISEQSINKEIKDVEKELE
jgi:hypothetical protein